MAKKRVSDKEIQKALIATGGQPVASAKIVGLKYPHLYTRIRQNPKLLEIQNSFRAKSFQDLSNTSLVWALTGVMKEPVTDPETGIVIPGEFVEKKVDYRTRSAIMAQMMGMLKSSEGIKDTLVIENESGVDLTKLSDTALDELEKAMKQKSE